MLVGAAVIIYHKLEHKPTLALAASGTAGSCSGSWDYITL